MRLFVFLGLGAATGPARPVRRGGLPLAGERLPARVLAAATRRTALKGVVLPLALAGGLVQAQNADVEAGEWTFVATLDGDPIGFHHFVVAGPAAARTVDSQAQFDVRLLGVPVYRYRHHAQERWQGDCLRELRSDTDDDGQPQHVDRRYDDDCRMSFAYWNPRLVTQTRLVDPQTGRTDAVEFERLPDRSLSLGGRTVAARGWLLRTPRQHITIWYAADSGRWLGLDAEVKGGRVLRYRPEAQDTKPAP